MYMLEFVRPWIRGWLAARRGQTLLIIKRQGMAFCLVALFTVSFQRIRPDSRLAGDEREREREGGIGAPTVEEDAALAVAGRGGLPGVARGSLARIMHCSPPGRMDPENPTQNQGEGWGFNPPHRGPLPGLPPFFFPCSLLPMPPDST